MSDSSSEFLQKITDEPLSEYAEAAARKKEQSAERNAKFMSDYLQSLGGPVRVYDALAFIGAYCSVHAPEIVKSAIAIHKVEKA